MRARKRFGFLSAVPISVAALLASDSRPAQRASLLRVACALAAVLGVAPVRASETVLHSFVPYPLGASPQANVCLGPGDNISIYGTALGGPTNNGVVFTVQNGHETVLHSFTGGNDGGSPFANVTCNSVGRIYGTTAFGGSSGAGVVYRVEGGKQNVLYSFTGGNDGGNPFAGLIQDSAGNLYGTTNGGGQAGAGVVFKLDTNGNETVLYSFTGGNDGAFPQAGVVLDSAGNLYGTTPFGGSAGAGVVYKVDPTGQETVLYSFTGGVDGANPFAGVVRDSAGNLYGAASGGGPAGGGALFKLDTTGHEAVLFGFPGLDGNNSQNRLEFGSSPSSLIQDSAGNLYGTTPFGGAANAGIVYKISPAGQETILYNFTGGADGANPFAGVVMDAAGNLYGTTNNGGAAGAGVVFKLDTKGHETVLHAFSCLGCPAHDGMSPNGGVIRDSAGNLYGTTSKGGSAGFGTVYKLDPTGRETVLYNFTNGADGANPTAGVTMDSAGDLYGTTVFGGIPAFFGGWGVAYRLDPAGNETTLYEFCQLNTPGTPFFCQDGSLPLGGVALDAAGNLYGGTFDGGPKATDGPGVIYKLDPTGQETVLYAFQGTTDGNGVRGNVVLDSAGNVYGTAELGGGAFPYFPFGFGVVFEVSPTGIETVLYRFTGGVDGAFPFAGVVRDAAGNLYGTTASGGAAGAGVVYKITP